METKNSRMESACAAAAAKVPVDVQEDVRSMERRRRVSSALDCKPFRDDLESIVGHAGAAAAVDFRAARPSTARGSCAIPIDDIHRFPTGAADYSCAMNVAEVELRCKVASLCRLIDSLQQQQRDDGESGGCGGRLCSTHVTARLSEFDELFLVNPYGLMLSEVTARSLLKVDAAGNLINEDGSMSPGLREDGLFVYNRASFGIHAAIHRTRFDVKCVIHVHHLPVVTVSCLKAGLLPLCREALLLGGISYHESQGASIDDNENIKRILCEELGPFNKVLIWRNHGMSICGESPQDVWSLTANAVKACRVQCSAMSVGLDNLIIPSELVQEEMIEASRVNLPSICDSNRAACEYEFEAAMRSLDMAGLKTGYHYKKIKPILPWMAKNQSSNNTPTAHPPSPKYQQISVPSSSTDWCFSPNAYVKNSPYSWTSSPNSPGVRPVVKLKSKLHFVGSVSSTSQELQDRCKELQEKRARVFIDAGPAGPIMRRSNEPPIPPISSPATVLVGAASKAIVKRSEQTNPAVYRSELATSNPFIITDRDEKYSLAEHSAQSPSLKGSSGDDERHNAISGSKENSKKKTSFRTPSFLRKRKGVKKENVPASRA